MSEALRVAVVGSGPSGLYAAAEVLKHDPSAQVDLIDRLPAMGGLVRSGVSPDHAARREVTAVYERLLMRSRRFRFHGNVDVGRHLSHAELLPHFHAVIHASGAAADKRLGITGEDLPGSYSATDFVGWYNGHPDFAHLQFDLSAERAVVVGNGNVALDVARLLLLPQEFLRRTDTADHALAALAGSAVREVVILGRRGPAQAAFTSPELLELGQMQGVDIIVEAPAATLTETNAPGSPLHALRLQLLREYAQKPAAGQQRRLVLRFLRSPLEIVGGTRVEGVRCARNELIVAPDGSVRAQATGDVETVPAGLVFRSVGYRALPLPGLPFDERAGVLPNEQGRVIDPDTRSPLAGAYVAGWLKRGPSGVIGSNKHCSRKTVAALLNDASDGRLPAPSKSAADFEQLLAERQPRRIGYHGWKVLDGHERRSGVAQGRPRVKVTSVDEMLGIAC